MKILSAFFLAALIVCFSFRSTHAQSSIPEWGKSASFGIIATHGISNTGASHITGDIGSIKQINGFQSNTMINGSIYNNLTNKYGPAQDAITDIYKDLTENNYYSSTTDLSGKILGSSMVNDLVPGTYSFSGNARISGTLRLNDGGNKLALYVFHIAANFNADAASKVLMNSGGSMPNVFWVVTGVSNIGTNAALAGNIITEHNDPLTDLAIIMNSGASISGKLVSYNAGISLNNNSVNKFLDTDGDGIADTYDDYPTDPTLAYNNKASSSTIIFEDLWPLKGDYDMNDVVMKYSYNLVTDAHNYVVQVISADTLVATGGTSKNAYCIEFPIPTGWVSSISSGSQETGQKNAVFMLFKNMRDEMTSWNTVPGIPKSAPKMYRIDFRIDPVNQVKLTDFTVAKINPFLVNYKGTSRREVHLPGKQPSTLADRSVFGTGDDASKLNSATTYVTANGLPWAITLPTGNFEYAAETIDISTAYVHFSDWAVSGGGPFIDWFSNTTDCGYRNYSFIYL